MLTALALSLLVVGADTICGVDQQIAGLCSVTNTGTTVDVGGTRPGGGTGEGGGTRDRTEPQPAPVTPACVPSITELCRGGYSVVLLTPTLTDVASFAPASVPVVDEPDGVGVVGMPMNFVVQAAVHESTGELFDLPVTVRFTPDSVLFRYGDGGTRTSSHGGSTWAQLGLPQFSATPTSHAYSARGTYSASAVVRYTAAVDFGGGWVAVPGVLEIATSASTVRVVEVRTALVERTCLEDPRGPGC